LLEVPSINAGAESLPRARESYDHLGTNATSEDVFPPAGEEDEADVSQRLPSDPES
jgi:hypothetical protein